MCEIYINSHENKYKYTCYYFLDVKFTFYCCIYFEGTSCIKFEFNILIITFIIFIIIYVENKIFTKLKFLI